MPVPLANNDGMVRPPGHNARRTGTIVGDRHAARLHGVDSSIWTITRLPTVRAVITLGLATGDAGTSGTHLGAAILDRHAARLHGVDSSIWTITRLPTVRAVITLGLATGDAGTSGTHLGAAIFPAG